MAAPEFYLLALAEDSQIIFRYLLQHGCPATTEVINATRHKGWLEFLPRLTELLLNVRLIESFISRGAEFNVISNQLQQLVKERQALRKDIVSENNKIAADSAISVKTSDVLTEPQTKAVGKSMPKTSKGMVELLAALDELGIKYTREVNIVKGRQHYDVGFSHLGAEWLAEFDGSQHFAEYGFANAKPLAERQKADIEKTQVALDHNQRLIRIDHSQLGKIKTCLVAALASKHTLYLSRADCYTWLLKGVTLGKTQTCNATAP